MSNPPYIVSGGFPLPYFATIPSGGPTVPAPGQGGYNASWYGATVIYWDPVSGSDTNSGTTSGAAIKTWAQVIQRYGSINAVHNYGQSVVVNLLSSQPAGSDPVFWSPRISGGGFIAIIGVPALLHTITAGTITAANRAAVAPTLLTIAGMPAGTVQDTLVYNSTRGSYAIIDNMSGTTAAMQSPLAASIVNTIGIVSETQVQDDSWRTSDTLSLYSLPSINLKEFDPSGWDILPGSAYPPGGNPSVGWLQFLNITDSSAGRTIGGLPLTCRCATLATSMCAFQGSVSLAPVGGGWNTISMIGASVRGYSYCLSGTNVWIGGAWGGGGQLVSGEIEMNSFFIIHEDASLQSGIVILNNVYCDADGAGGGYVNFEGGVRVAIFPGNILYGTCLIALSGGAVWDVNSSWASQVLGPTLSIMDSTTGTYVSGGVQFNGIPLTPANIDKYGALFDPHGGGALINYTTIDTTPTIQFPAAYATPSLGQAAPTTDVAPIDFVLSAQPAFHAATVNTVSANVVVTPGAPASGHTTIGQFKSRAKFLLQDTQRFDAAGLDVNGVTTITTQVAATVSVYFDSALGPGEARDYQIVVCGVDVSNNYYRANLNTLVGRVFTAAPTFIAGSAPAPTNVIKASGWTTAAVPQLAIVGNAVAIQIVSPDTAYRQWTLSIQTLDIGNGPIAP